MDSAGGRIDVGTVFTIPRHRSDDMNFQVHSFKCEGKLPTEKEYIDVTKSISDFENYNAVERADLLQLAIASGNNELALLLINEKGVDINRAGSNLDTPLHVAIASGRVELARLFIQRGVNVNQTGWNGSTALHIAAATGNIEAVQFLIENGANVNQASSNDAPYYKPASYSSDLSRRTHQLVMDIGSRRLDLNGDRPLHLASLAGSLSVMRLLFTNGANLEALGAFGNTALQIAVINEHWEVAEELLSYGVERESGQYDYTTALLNAAFQGRNVIVSLLLKWCANRNVVGIDGESALHWAIRGGHKSTVQLMLNHCSTSQTEKDIGRAIAADIGNIEIFAAMVDKSESAEKFVDLKTMMSYEKDDNPKLSFVILALKECVATCLLVRSGRLLRKILKCQAAPFGGRPCPASSDKILLPPIEMEMVRDEFDPMCRFDFNRVLSVQLSHRPDKCGPHAELQSQKILVKPELSIIGKVTLRGMEVMRNNLASTRSAARIPSYTMTINQKRKHVILRRQRYVPSSTVSTFENSPLASSNALNQLSTTPASGIENILDINTKLPLESIVQSSITVASANTTNLALTSAGLGFAALGVLGVAAGVDGAITARKTLKYQIEEGKRTERLAAKNRSNINIDKQAHRPRSIINAKAAQVPTVTKKTKIDQLQQEARHSELQVQGISSKVNIRTDQQQAKRHTRESDVRQADIKLQQLHAELCIEEGASGFSVEYLQNQAKSLVKDLQRERNEVERLKNHLREEKSELDYRSVKFNKEKVKFNELSQGRRLELVDRINDLKNEWERLKRFEREQETMFLEESQRLRGISTSLEKGGRRHYITRDTGTQTSQDPDDSTADVTPTQYLAELSHTVKSAYTSSSSQNCRYMGVEAEDKLHSSDYLSVVTGADIKQSNSPAETSLEVRFLKLRYGLASPQCVENQTHVESPVRSLFTSHHCATEPRDNGSEDESTGDSNTFYDAADLGDDNSNGCSYVSESTSNTLSADQLDTALWENLSKKDDSKSVSIDTSDRGSDGDSCFRVAGFSTDDSYELSRLRRSSDLGDLESIIKEHGDRAGKE